MLTSCQTIGSASPRVDRTIISILGMKKDGEIGYSIQNGFRGKSCGWGEWTAAWAEKLAGWKMCLRSMLGSFSDGQDGTDERGGRRGSL